MSDQMEDSIIFAMHIGLLSAKIIASFVIAKMFIIKKSLDKTSFMFMGKSWLVALFLFTISILFAEVWILSNYYLVSSNFYYEALSMLDQLILTSMFILSYKGGNNNGT